MRGDLTERTNPQMKSFLHSVDTEERLICSFACRAFSGTQRNVKGLKVGLKPPSTVHTEQSCRF